MTDTTEREAFEAWHEKMRRASWVVLHGDPRKEAPDHWNTLNKEERWKAWQARASLPAQPAQAVGGDAGLLAAAVAMYDFLKDRRTKIVYPHGSELVDILVQAKTAINAAKEAT